jgi:hypothetical protein
MVTKKFFLGKGRLSPNNQYINFYVYKDSLNELTPDSEGRVYLTLGLLKPGVDPENTHYVGLDKLKQEKKEHGIARYTELVEGQQRREGPESI